jgi:hypothetical protein
MQPEIRSVQEQSTIQLINTWTAITTTGAPAPRSSHTAIWDRSRMIVWGGSGECCNNWFNDRFGYRPKRHPRGGGPQLWQAISNARPYLPNVTDLLPNCPCAEISRAETWNECRKWFCHSERTKDNFSTVSSSSFGMTKGSVQQREHEKL